MVGSPMANRPLGRGQTKSESKPEFVVSKDDSSSSLFQSIFFQLAPSSDIDWKSNAEVIPFCLC